MNRFDQSSQPLELTPLVWVALAVVALLGLSRLMRDPQDGPALDYFQREELVVVRSRASTHLFPSLGIEITLPSDWSYLSVLNDVSAARPTFVNEAQQSIVRIQALPEGAWPLEAEVTEHRYGDATVHWIDRGRRRLVLSVNELGMDLSHEWIEYDPRSVGRLTKGNSQVTIVAITHSTEPVVNESIEAFCAAIESMDAGD